VKALFLSTLALTATVGAAVAADLPQSYKAPASAPPAYNWSGVFIGAHGGYGWGQFQDVSNPDAQAQSTKGGFGGLQIGYNYQPVGSSLVAGVEADVSFGSIGKTWRAADTSGSPFDPYYGSDKMEMFGTVRGRIGYAFDRVMPYVTGGLLWSRNRHDLGCDIAVAPAGISNGCQNRVAAFDVSETKTSLGWVVGAGIESAIAGNWTARAEYLYGTTDTGTVNLPDPNYPTARSLRDFDGHVNLVRVGLNYRF